MVRNEESRVCFPSFIVFLIYSVHICYSPKEWKKTILEVTCPKREIEAQRTHKRDSPFDISASLHPFLLVRQCLDRRSSFLSLCVWRIGTSTMSNVTVRTMIWQGTWLMTILYDYCGRAWVFGRIEYALAFMTCQGDDPCIQHSHGSSVCLYEQYKC